MNNIKQLVLECDFFAHSSLYRYKEEQSYRTLAGGIVSIVLIFFFIIIFSSLVINTFQKNLIISSESKIYHDDPKYAELTVDPTKNYMFAIGLTGIDLSSTQRYFDIVLSNKTYAKNGSNTIKTTQNIPLTPCKLSQWSGVTDGITKSYTTQALNQWLCPPSETKFGVQGKFSSQIFKFAQLVVSKCSNNPLFPNTTCKSSTEVTSFLTANGQFTFNIFLINPVVNPENPQFITYYLQDSNYFAFDTITGVSANLFYNDYTVTTDTTLLPWKEEQVVTGSMTTEVAVGQNYQIASNLPQYFRFYFRKAAHQIQYYRSFQKLDQTFSYIGGLFGTIALLLLFLKIYSKYSYELDLGDKIFKQNHGGSFGSQNFNFVVFMGYLLFVIFTKFGVVLNWKTMKRYHKCRMECQKQLNVDLLMQKITHFEQIAKIVLEQHHLKMLIMVPKPTIKEAKLNRKRYLMKSIIYHQLQRKAKDLYVDPDQYQRRLRQFLKQDEFSFNQIIDNSDQSETCIKGIQQQMVASFKKLKNTQNEDRFSFSRKIKERLSFEGITTAIFQFMRPSFVTNNQHQQIGQTSPQKKQISSEPFFTNFQQIGSQMQLKTKKLDPISLKKRDISRQDIELQQ